MRPAKFEYFAPESLGEAAALLAEADGVGRIMAGGQSLMAAMNLRLARPSCVIDLRRIPGLNGIVVEAGTVRIGAMATHAALIASPQLQSAIPLISMAGRHIAHLSIREHGTMGGSLALADPASEWATVLSLLGGRLRAVNVRGERWIDAQDFFVSFYTTDLAPDEILAEIEIPLPKPGTQFAFKEFVRQEGAFAIAMAAVARLPAGGMSAVIGGCGPRPLRLDLGQMANGAGLDGALNGALGRASFAPGSDIHASAEDRRTIAISLLKSCIAGLLPATEEGGV